MEIVFYPSIFSKRKLIFDKESHLKLSYVNQYLIKEFKREEIVGFRFGIEWISAYMFPVGLKFYIEVLNINGNTIKLTQKSFYGIRYRSMRNSYIEILNSLFDTYFDEIYQSYFRYYSQKEDIEFDKISIKSSGVLFKNKQVFIPYSELNIRGYKRFFVLSSINDSKIQLTLTYIDDYNSYLIYNLIKEIMK